MRFVVLDAIRLFFESFMCHGRQINELKSDAINAFSKPRKTFKLSVGRNSSTCKSNPKSFQFCWARKQAIKRTTRKFNFSIAHIKKTHGFFLSISLPERGSKRYLFASCINFSKKLTNIEVACDLSNAEKCRLDNSKWDRRQNRKLYMTIVCINDKRGSKGRKTVIQFTHNFYDSIAL